MSGLRVAAEAVDLSPSSPVPLFGYVGRRGPFLRVADPLEASVLVLRAASAPPVALVSVDTLYVTDALRIRLLEAGARAGLRDADLLLAATHTHFAPALDPGKPALGAHDPTYLASATERLAGALAAALAAPGEPAEMRYRVGLAAHAVSRRGPPRGPLAWVRGLGAGSRSATVGMVPNPEGDRDDALHLLSFDAPDGRPLARLWSGACHPVGYPHRDRVSAEFPGVTRRQLRAATRTPNLPVLFLQGFAGDLRPREVGGLPTAARLRARLTHGAAFGVFDLPRWAAWASSLADRVVALDRTLAAALRAAPKGARVSIPLAELVDSHAGAPPVSVHALRLAEGLTLLAIAGEPVSAYGARARTALAPSTVIPVGYAGEVATYLPTEAMLAEGGYEVTGAWAALGLSGGPRPGLELRITAALADLARTLEASGEATSGP